MSTQPAVPIIPESDGRKTTTLELLPSLTPNETLAKFGWPYDADYRRMEAWREQREAERANDVCAACKHAYSAHGLISGVCPDNKGFFTRGAA